MKHPLDERAIRHVFLVWWNETFNNKAELARLRRIGLVTGPSGPLPDVVAALTVPAFRNLLARIEPLWSLNNLEDQRVEDLVVAAVTLARMKDNTEERAAKLLGKGDGKEAKMKEASVLSLMRCSRPNELFNQGRRIASLLGGKANIGDLGATLLLWRTQIWVRRNWARDYYHHDLTGREGGSAPEADTL